MPEGGTLENPPGKFCSVILCNHGGNSIPEQLKDLMTIVKKNPALDDRTTLEDKAKISGDTINQIL